MAHAMNVSRRTCRLAHLVLTTHAKRRIMPVDRTRAVNSQGRQKSCAQCAKSKRKCGLEQPSCIRCIRQHVSCIYPPQPRTQTATPHDSTPNNDIGTDDAQLHMGISEAEDVNLDFDFDMSAIATASTADFLDFDFPTSTSCTNPLAAVLRQSPDAENQMTLQRNHAQSKNSFSLTHLSPFAKARMGYGVEHIKLAPRMMVEQNCTPWIHPMLYDEHMPRSLEDAYAACALYIVKNQTNAERIACHIQSRAEDLMKAAIPDSPVEILARTHAIMLYQIMLVFGGDFRFYTQAEALLPYLEKMGALLVPIAAEENDPVGPLPLYPTIAAHAAWKSYIFRESTRRTLLSAFQITIMCNVLSGQMKTCSENVSLGSFITLSAHLWNATNAIDFAMNWNTKNHFVVKDLDFTYVLDNAQPDDLDVFANIFLISLRGIDDIRGWYLTRGGALNIPWT